MQFTAEQCIALGSVAENLHASEPIDVEPTNLHRGKTLHIAGIDSTARSRREFLVRSDGLIVDMDVLMEKGSVSHDNRVKS